MGATIERDPQLPSIDFDSAACGTRHSAQVEIFHAHSGHALKVFSPSLPIVEEGQQLLVFRHREFNGEIEIRADGRATLCSAAQDKKRSDPGFAARPVDKHVPRKLLHGRPPKAASPSMLCPFLEGRKSR